ncbi:MAG: hypothetical protein H6868_06480 [Rhodospirillales bacterium]|nr:hypothetical protein [Rhodospirillales bacterium]
MIKYCLTFLFVLLTALPAQAQTPVSDKMADIYFSNCIAKRDERMTIDTQEIMCQCTALLYQKNMSVEELQVMAQNDQAGRNALNRMLVLVYAPCMEFPVRDLIYYRCMENKFQSQKGICGCLADKMAQYTAESAADKLSAVLRNSPNITDPMEPIVNSPEFAQMEKRLALSCIQEDAAPK